MCFFMLFKRFLASFFVIEYIHYYNYVRIQEKLNYLYPKAFREQVV
ncbi:TPA: IS3 family transposase [Bacillus pacificus]